MISLSDYLKNELNRPFESEIIKFLISLAVENREEYMLEPSLDLRSTIYNGGTGDIYFPEGLKALGVELPLMIEIKGRLLLSVYSRELKKAKAYVESHQRDCYWVIYANTILNASNIENEGRIRFVSFEALKKLARGYEPVENKKSDWRPKNQKSVISKAAQCLKNSRCSFILGAGISVDAGSPSWDNLLKELLKNIPNHKPIDETDYPNINSKCGWSALITARYVISDYLKPDDLTRRMRGIIYTCPKCSYKKYPTAIPLIADITKQCNIESILTFNYDEFVEEALDRVGVKVIPIYGKGAMAADEKPVYHIHGFISRNKGGVDSYPVLSEREYHNLYSDDFHWSNVELLHALTRNTCFLVGLSMSDPNLRRLLDIARYDDSGNARHFVFMRREPLDISNSNPKKDKKHWDNIERQFEGMGLNIIWFDYNPNDKGDFSDLAAKLSEILRQYKTLDKKVG